MMLGGVVLFAVAPTSAFILAVYVARAGHRSGRIAVVVSGLLLLALLLFSAWKTGGWINVTGIAVLAVVTVPAFAWARSRIKPPPGPDGTHREEGSPAPPGAWPLAGPRPPASRVRRSHPSPAASAPAPATTTPAPDPTTAALAGAPTASQQPGLRLGSHGSAVKTLQQRLTTLHYFDVATADGVFEHDTYHAVIAFQEVQG